MKKSIIIAIGQNKFIKKMLKKISCYGCYVAIKIIQEYA